MTQRRYDEAEVAAIFERAARTPTGPREPSPPDGMTLAELQAIGREVGIPAESIARAARTVEGQAPAPPPARTFLGVPVGVAHTVQLDRRLSDEEWEHVVVDLRQTFDARGTVRSQGRLRQWTNGNLQALVEPTAAGDRIRLRTVKGDARAMLGVGATLLGTSLAALLAGVTQAAPLDATALTAMSAIGLAGVGTMAATALRLPRWARTRRRQMEEIAERLTGAAPPPGWGR